MNKRDKPLVCEKRVIQDPDLREVGHVLAERGQLRPPFMRLIATLDRKLNPDEDLIKVSLDDWQCPSCGARTDGEAEFTRNTIMIVCVNGHESYGADGWNHLLPLVES